MSGQTVIYMKLERSVEVTEPEIYLKDVASVECKDQRIKECAREICIHKFKAQGQKRTVISVLRVIQLLEETFGKGILVQSVGEKDTFVQWVREKEKNSKANIWKIVLVSAVTFCGTAFTIIAYHNDIEIHKMFEGTVRLILPRNLELGLLILELAYSIGLAVGIVVFFNHVGKWKLSNDPTPIEVALRKYEQEVDTTLIENADREGAEVEVN